MRIVAVAATVVLLLSAAGPAHAANDLAVTGYQQEGDAAALIDRSAVALTTVGVDGVLVDTDGAGVGRPSAAADHQRDRAHADGLRAELLVSNYSNDIGDFSEPVAHRLLGTTSHIKTVAAALAADVASRGWDGICVDLEALLPRDAAGLVAFVTRLRADLPTGASLSIAVSNSTRASDYAENGYLLGQIAAQVDVVQLMAYDQHGPWENTPGPIGALPWQAKGLRAALTFVPAAKLDLGVAGYGYAWRPHSNDTLSDAQARKLAGSAAHFDRTAGEWTASLADGSTLWWSDARSYALRVALAKSFGLHGLAVWCLGSSDPIS